MSKIPNNDDGLNDTDIATLFASNNSGPPKELDKLILDNALASQHDSLAQQHETFTQKYAPLFGTAAVLMIAIGLTPLTMNAPESTPELAQGPTPTPMQTTISAEASPSRQTADSEQNTKAAPGLVDTANADSNADIFNASDETAAPQTSASVTRIANRTNKVESTAELPVTVADTDAVGIDENIVLQSESADSDTAKQDNYTNEEELIANDASIGLAEKKAANVDNIESTDSIVNAELNTELNAELNADLESADPAPKVAEIAATPNKQVADESKLAHSNTIVSDVFSTSNEDHSPASSIKPLDAVEAQSHRIELKENKAIQKKITESTTIAPDSRTNNESVRLKQVQEKNESIYAEQDASQTNKLTPERTKNFRSSALLWVIEIKRLYKEKKVDQAREELVLFRQKHPDNVNERLLPKELLDSLRD